MKNGSAVACNLATSLPSLKTAYKKKKFGNTFKITQSLFQYLKQGIKQMSQKYCFHLKKYLLY